IAGVNSSVVVPSGTTAGGFNVFTSQVTTPTVVTISVSGGGVTQSAQLTVNPDAMPAAATPAGLTVSPPPRVGGASSQGTVTLSGAAPAGGMSVSLSSSSAAAAVPASVIVAQGATSATFVIATSAVATSTPATISASAAGVSKSASLTVMPQGQAATVSL